MKLSYANVTATVALFVALGGGAYAATQVPANSVGTKQLRNNAVTGVKIKNGSISGAKIEASSLPTVPSATHANSADRAATASTADSANRAGSADQAGNSEELNGYAGERFVAILTGRVQDVPATTSDTVLWGAVSGIAPPSSDFNDVTSMTPAYSTGYASGLDIEPLGPSDEIAGEGQVRVSLYVNREWTPVTCTVVRNNQGCINQRQVNYRVRGGSELVYKIDEEPASGEEIPSFSLATGLQISPVEPKPE